MLRRTILLTLVALIASGMAVAADLPWFDTNCAMCKNIFANKDLMKSMTWEGYDLTNGVILITSVDGKYLADYRKAQMGMMEVMAKTQKGEEVYLCGSCTELGKCMMKGAAQQHVMTSTGDVMLLTSDNDELVAELQAWNKRNEEEKKNFDPTKG